MPQEFDYELIQPEAQASHLLLRLNRPGKKNALNAQMRSELLDLLKRMKASREPVVITGNGDSFCAGLDLKESDPEQAAREMWEIAHALYDSPCICIAAVNGAARGGGVTLVNACDLALAAPEASFGMPEIGFGVYAAVAGPTTQLAVPKKAVARMLLTGEALSAEAAERAGLINEVVAGDELLEMAARLAEQVAAHDSTALAAAKQGLNALPFDRAMRQRGQDLAVMLNTQIREGRRGR